MSDVLRIEKLRASRNEARLVDFVYTGPEHDLALQLRGDGDEVLVRTRFRRAGDDPRAGGERVVERYAVNDTSLTALDRTVFSISERHFAEVALFHAGTENLHATPIVLPASLRLDEWHTPFPGVPARVSLCFVGEVRMVLGARRSEVEALCMLAEQGGERRLQWMAQGVGEVCIGSSGAPSDQWLRAWQSPAGSIFGGLDQKYARITLPTLETGSGALPRENLF